MQYASKMVYEQIDIRQFTQPTKLLINFFIHRAPSSSFVKLWQPAKIDEDSGGGEEEKADDPFL